MSQPIYLDPKNIPEPFHPLIPFAEKWGIRDDGFLDQAIDEASIAELRNLISAISEFDVEGFDEWLAEPGATGSTKEWIAFVSLIDAYDLAKLRLRTMSSSNDQH